MLGLRHFNGHAIDLFLGDITQFQNDGIVRLGVDFIPELRAHFAAGRRHIAVAVDNDGSAAEAAIPELHAFLSTAHAKMNHRITFVATAHETYALFQKVIFATFADSE